MNEPAIRIATSDDEQDIIDIYNATISSCIVTADLQPISVGDRRDWFDSHAKGPLPLWVAEVSGAVAGWASLETFKARAAYDNTAEFSIYVSEQHRGRRLGQTLLTHAMEHAPAHNVNSMIGYVGSKNEPSLRLLRKNGFEDWGLLPDVLNHHGTLSSVVILGRRV